ncbi:nodulation protein NfeD [Paraburkholderia sp. BL21I4N1]|uniref:NfeD family protein n=1 Tax=Paraburkholderia sp. BL21I4N1 TaxID=1938801 RepID=UPI000CFC7336|nr:nodulation protein NfeD [Paraburkholderia sp. BL21I4N1]PQV54927.1 membrane-bound serine protease (ClpP class) [Paraburkholderia sp. BL21I4N1]
MSTYPRLPFRQSGSHMPLIRGAVVSRLMRGMTALGVLLALGFASCETLAPLRADAAVTSTAAPGSVVVIPVDGAIDPASADFIVRSLQRAAEQRAQLAVLQLDTPGGLDTSMRQIIKAILASPVPVATFIAPSGARAASAGTYIVYASHIAAMAPGTNLGAATPIQMGMGGAEPPAGGGMPGLPGNGAGNGAGAGAGAGAGSTNTGSAAASAPSGASAPVNANALPLDTQSTELRKQVHDAAAYIRGLAQMRGRNADWAERAVREAVSLSAAEALAQHVVDLNARDLPDLLRQLDGRKVTTRGGDVTLDTARAPIVTLEADWRSRFLAVITDPNVALVLLMIGMYGLFFEFANPGFVLPGVVGAISLLMGLFAMQMLPVNYVGLGLIFLGIAFLIGEAFLPTFGSLGFGGVVAFVIGALMLIDTDVPGYGIPLPMIAAVVVFSVLFVLGVSRLALRARRRPVVTGAEALIGSIGVVLDGGLLPEKPAAYAPERPPTNPTAPLPETTTAHAPLAGWAQVHGERWRVSSAAPVAAGHFVRVTARHGLTLTVVPAEGRQQGERS